MKFSVIIPSYNQAAYIEEAVESVLSQTFHPHEIIIIDDGSTDGSLEIAKRYRDENLNVKLVKQVNKGLASARNTGIMNATGDYIFPLDADDMMVENCLERVNERAEKKFPDVIAPSFKCFGVVHDVVTLKPNIVLKDFLIGNRLGYFSAYKRSVALEVGGYSPKMTWGYEDLHFWINLLARGKKISVIQEPLILYRVKEKSMIHEAQSHHDELMAQIKKDFPELYE